MRRVLVLFVITALVVGTQASADVDRKKKRRGARTVEVPYENGAIQFVACFECPQTFSRPGERFLSVEVIEDISPRGYVDIVWGDSASHEFFPVCGKTQQPQPIPSVETFTIYPWRIPDEICQGFTTSGIVKLTFLRSR